MTLEPDMTSTSHAQTSPAVPLQPDTPARLDSALIFCGQKTVEIEHGEQRYTLRVTRDNKLILTK